MKSGSKFPPQKDIIFFLFIILQLARESSSRCETQERNKFADSIKLIYFSPLVLSFNVIFIVKHIFFVYLSLILKICSWTNGKNIEKKETQNYEFIILFLLPQKPFLRSKYQKKISQHLPTHTIYRYTEEKLSSLWNAISWKEEWMKWIVRRELQISTVILFFESIPVSQPYWNF